MARGIRGGGGREAAAAPPVVEFGNWPWRRVGGEYEGEVACFYRRKEVGSSHVSRSVLRAEGVKVMHRGMQTSCETADFPLIGK